MNFLLSISSRNFKACRRGHAVEQVKDTMRWGLILALSFVFSPGVAVAQSSSEETLTIEEIIVTARKREQSLQDIPASIAALAGSKLEQMGAAGLQDYYRQIPSLQFTDRGPSRNNIVIRGVSTDSVGDESATAVYFDEVPVSQNASNPDLHVFDVKRVEVLRGPQGTLYGAGSMGGTVRIITNKVDPKEFSSKLDVSLSNTKEGSFNYNLNGAVNLPLVEDRVGLRIVGYYHDEDGFIDNINPRNSKKNIAATERKGARVNAFIQASENLTISPTFIYQKTSTDGLPEDQFTLPALKQSRFLDETLDDKFFLATLNLGYELGDWAVLSSITSYVDRTTAVVADNTLLNFALRQVPTTNVSPNISDTDFKTVTQELRLTSAGDGRLSWIAGVFYSDQTSKGRSRTLGDGSGNLAAFFGIDPVANGFAVDTVVDLSEKRLDEQLAFFGEASYEIIPSLTGTVGLRYFDIDIDFKGQTGFEFGDVFSGGAAPNTFATPPGKFSETGTNPKFNLAYAFDDDTLLYVQAAKGFRRGRQPSSISQDCRVRFAAENLTLPGAVKSDDLWNYEIGGKKSFMNNRLVVNATAFYIDWSDIQIVTDFERAADPANNLPACTTSFRGNGEDATVMGLEMEVSLAATESLDLSFSGGYTNGELDQSVPGLRASKGDRIPGVPELKLSVSADYNFRLFDAWDGFWNLSLAYESESKTFFREQFGTEAGDYAIVNTRLGAKFGRWWRVSLFVNNLFNKSGRLYSDVLARSNLNITGDPGTPFDPSVGRTRPRTIGINIRADFN